MISLIIPVFNNQKSIFVVFQSIKKNLTSNDELVIVDDHSTDGTWEILKSLKAKNYEFNFKLFRNRKNLGISPSLNFCIKNATKQYIARHDGDDIMILGRLEHQLKLMQNNSEIDLLTSSRLIFKSYENIKSFPKISKNLKIPRKIDKNSMAVNNLVAHPTLFCKAFILKQNLYDSSYNCDGEDYQLWLRLVKKEYKFFKDNTNVIMYYENNNKDKLIKQFIGSIRARISVISIFNPIFSIYLLKGSLFDFLRLIRRIFSK